jgi:hypothetical protein
MHSNEQLVKRSVARRFLYIAVSGNLRLLNDEVFFFAVTV